MNRELANFITVFRKYLHFTDSGPLLALAATLVANKATGDPVWLLLVGAPSTGKTEMLNAAKTLPWVHEAAEITKASLLSGTPAKDRARNATGGLLRQIGDFGVLLVKDFTSVLSQHKDASAEALAALREVYDGSWHRAMAVDGGKVLSWQGKCGLVGGVTPVLDRYSQVISSLGDRFLLYRTDDADHAAAGRLALSHRGQEQTMRAEMTAAMVRLVGTAGLDSVNAPLALADEDRLITLAEFTARARTGVVRDGYDRQVAYIPQAEGPGRIIAAYGRLLGALRAIGCDDETAWLVLNRIAVSCMPAARAGAIRALIKVRPLGWAKTSALAIDMRMVSKTAREHLSDLELLGFADRDRRGEGDNSPDLWMATDDLAILWPGDTRAPVPDPTLPKPKTGPKAEQRNLLLSPDPKVMGSDDHEESPIKPKRFLGPTLAADIGGSAPQNTDTTQAPVPAADQGELDLSG